MACQACSTAPQRVRHSPRQPLPTGRLANGDARPQQQRQVSRGEGPQPLVRHRPVRVCMRVGVPRSKQGVTPWGHTLKVRVRLSASSTPRHTLPGSTARTIHTYVAVSQLPAPRTSPQSHTCCPPPHRATLTPTSHAPHATRLHTCAPPLLTTTRPSTPAPAPRGSAPGPT